MQIEQFDLNKSDELESVYTKKYMIWRYCYSNEITVENRPLTAVERSLLILPDEETGKPRLGLCVVDELTKKGTPLEEIRFIHQEKSKYNLLLQSTVGNMDLYDQHYRYNKYIDFLGAIENLLINDDEPKFLTKYPIECLIEIADYLIRKEQLTGSIDDWLWWWNKKTLYRPPKKMNFKTKTLLVNLIKHKLQGSENAPAMKAAFGIEKADPDTLKVFENSLHGRSIDKILKKYPL